MFDSMKSLTFYQHRDWDGGLATEDEATLWKRVSSNHALNALSLARLVNHQYSISITNPNLFLHIKYIIFVSFESIYKISGYR